MRFIDIMLSLKSRGYEALLVGGCVRDDLLNVKHTDVDLVTNATPDEVISIFKGVKGATVDAVGKVFGVVIVNGYEVATFRSETYNVPGKPEVSFAKSFKEDSARRDFTINAMAMDFVGDLYDFHGGREDIKNKLIRAVGDPAKRFQEDPSRILRGIELASRLDFTIEPETKRTMKQLGYLLKGVPHALVGKIVKKAILNNKLSRFVVLLNETDTLKYIFPELSHTVGLPQNPKYHKYDVFGHTVAVIRAAESLGDPLLLLTALLHDSAKGLKGVRGVNAQGMPNDLGHEEASVPIAKSVLQRLEFDKWAIHAVTFVINFHGVRFDATAKSNAYLKVLRKMAKWYTHRDELFKAVRYLCLFMKCDVEGFSDRFRAEIKPSILSLEPNLLGVLSTNAFYPSDLHVNGKDLMDLGFRGKAIGDMIKRLIQLNFNSREETLAYLDKYIRERN